MDDCIGVPRIFTMEGFTRGGSINFPKGGRVWGLENVNPPVGPRGKSSAVGSGVCAPEAEAKCGISVQFLMFCV